MGIWVVFEGGGYPSSTYGLGPVMVNDILAPLSLQQINKVENSSCEAQSQIFNDYLCFLQVEAGSDNDEDDDEYIDYWDDWDEDDY